MARWIRSAFRRIFGFPGDGLYFNCKLTAAGASRLELTALCGLGHYRESLVHDWLCYSAEVGDDDHLLPGLKEAGELRLARVVLPKLPRLRLLAATPGQEHLVDRHGYVPGVYQLDAETAPVVIALLNEPGHLELSPIADLLTDNAVGAGDCAQHCDTKGQPFDPGHTVEDSGAEGLPALIPEQLAEAAQTQVRG